VAVRPSPESQPAETAWQWVEPVRFSTAGPDPSPRRETCRLPVEAPLVIEVKDLGAFTVMSSPEEGLALAAGFLLSEGLIRSRDDIALAQHCVDDPGVIRVTLTGRPQAGDQGRNLLITSSCGLCGSKNLDQLIADLPRVGDSLRVSAAGLGELGRAMRRGQALFGLTGGTHAAAIFSAEGRLLSLAEDLGRHNALDKAIGRMILAGRPLAGLGAILSGRVSLEMAVKAVRAGLEIVAAVSAPTSLALEVAQACGLTLCGFLREDRATVYAHPHRLLGLEG